MAVPLDAKVVSARIEDFLRSIQRELAECTRENEAPENAERLVLGDWTIVTHFIDPDDSAENWYRVFNSPGLSPHAQEGLLRTGLEL